jgi:hypothetical protein
MRLLCELKRKYEPAVRASDMLLFLMKKSKQGRTKMIEDGIMDIRWRCKRIGTGAEEVASGQ